MNKTQQQTTEARQIKKEPMYQGLAPSKKFVKQVIANAIDEFEQLRDFEGVSLDSEKPFNFACCDCGLVHRVVIVSEDGKPVGFAVERDQAATEARRAFLAKHNGGAARATEGSV